MLQKTLYVTHVVKVAKYVSYRRIPLCISVVINKFKFE